MGLLSGIIKGFGRAVQTIRDLPGKINRWDNRWDLSRDIRKSSKPVQTVTEIPVVDDSWRRHKKRHVPAGAPVVNTPGPVQPGLDIPVADDSWRRHKKRRVPAGGLPEPPLGGNDKFIPPEPPLGGNDKFPPKPGLSDEFLALCSVAGLDFDLLDDFVAKYQELCSRLGPKTSFTDDEYREIMFAVQIYMEQMTMMDRYIDWGSVDGTYIDAWGNIVSESDNSIIKSAGSF